MSGKLSRKSETPQGRRSYLFALLTAVFFLVSLFIFPQRATDSRLTSVEIRVSATTDPEQLKTRVIDTIRQQLSVDQLRVSLENIARSAPLESELLGQADVEQIRARLMDGALSLQALPETGTDSRLTENEPAGNAISAAGGSHASGLEFSIALRGSGTPDEAILVEAWAAAIRDAVDPRTVKERALLQLSEIQTQLRDTAGLNQEIRRAMEASLEKITTEPPMLLTESAPEASRISSGSGREDWELKNLIEQRDLVAREYQSNQDLDFIEKADVQTRLMRRIEQLDQEIERLQQESGSVERVAERAGSVEKASFSELESGTGGTPATASWQKLKTDLALVVNKLDLASQSQNQAQASARSLSEMLQEQSTEVRVTAPRITEDRAANLTRLWLLLAISGVLSGLVVTRIDSRAFARLLTDPRTLEQEWSLPIIGQVNLPDSEGAVVKVRAAHRWVRSLIRICELTLLAAFLLFLTVLFIHSQFSVDWLSDPVRILENSFR